MNDQAPLHCREELSLPVRLTAALVVLLLLLPYHPLTWIATAHAGPHASYCHASDGPCTCAHHDVAGAPAHDANAHDANAHDAIPPAAAPHEDTGAAASVPPCHAAEADEQVTAMLEATGIAPPATHLCGCGHDAEDLTSAVAIDRFVLHGVSGTGGPPAPDAPTAVTAAAHLQPMAADIFHPPPPVQ